MKNLLVKVIAQETINGVQSVDNYIQILQENLDKFLSFETKVTLNAHNAEVVEIFFEEDTEDNSQTFKLVSFNFKGN